VGELDALHFRGTGFASVTTAARHEMRAFAETVGTAAVWADTTRLHPVGQEGGLRWMFPVAEHSGFSDV